METSPNLEPFIPPDVPSPSTPSAQPSIPDHTEPPPSPLVSAGYPADTDMFITQIPSALPPLRYISGSQSVKYKCDYCHAQVTTQVTRRAEWIADPFVAIPYWCRFMLWLLCCVCFGVVVIVQFLRCPTFVHTCPNCRAVLCLDKHSSRKCVICRKSSKADYL